MIHLYRVIHHHTPHSRKITNHRRKDTHLDTVLHNIKGTLLHLHHKGIHHRNSQLTRLNKW